MPQRSAMQRAAIRREYSGRLLLVSGLILAFAWIASRWYILWLWCDRNGNTTGYGVGRGMVGIREFVSYPTGDWNRFALDQIPNPSWELWQWQPQAAGFTVSAISFWPLAVVLTAAGVVLLAWARRERAAFPPGAGAVPASPLTRSRGRRRIAGGAGLVSAGLLFAAAWAASSLWSVEAQRHSWTINFSSGLVTVTHGRAIKQGLRWRWFDRPVGDPSFFWEGRSYSTLTAVAVTPGAPGMFPPFPPVTKAVAEWKVWIVGGATLTPDKVRTLAVWPFPPLMLACGVLLLWSGVRIHRRTRAGLCLSCGYDRAGLAVGAPCPECGESVAEK